MEEDETKDQPKGREGKEDQGRLIPGVILIVLGIVFLLPRLGIDFGNLWPLLVVAPGIAFLVYYVLSKNKEDKAGIMIPAVITLLLGLFLLYQNLSNWSDADKLWPVYPLIVGISFYVFYLAGGRKEKGILIPANILALVGVGFLFLNFLTFNLWPLFLIIAGLVLILLPYRKKKTDDKQSE